MADWRTQLTSAQRRKAMSEALQKQGMQQPQQQTVGGAVLPTTALSALAPILSTGLGVYGEKKADEQIASATDARQKAMAEWLQRAPAGGNERNAWAAEGENFGGMGAAVGGKALETAFAAPDVKYQDVGDAIAIFENGVEKGRIPKGISAEAKQSDETTRRGQDTSAGTAVRGQDVTMRGQDLVADTTRRGQDIGANTAAAGQKTTLDAARIRAQAGTGAKMPVLQSMDYVADQMRSAFKSVKTGGPMGIQGKLSGVLDYQDASMIDNLAQQMSTELRTIFRIPGEGALSDKEQAQYGLQLPTRNFDEAKNEQILRDLQNRARLRLGQPLLPEAGALQPQPGDTSDGWSITEE